MRSPRVAVALFRKTGRRNRFDISHVVASQRGPITYIRTRRVQSQLKAGHFFPSVMAYPMTSIGPRVTRSAETFSTATSSSTDSDGPDLEVGHEVRIDVHSVANPEDPPRIANRPRGREGTRPRRLEFKGRHIQTMGLGTWALSYK
jgi:hypothetical protein